MGNPLPRTQSLTRQRSSSAPRWDAFSKQNRPHALFSNRGIPSTDRVRSFMSGELTSSGRPRSFLSGELPLVRPLAPTTTNPAALKDAATNTELKDASLNTDDNLSTSGSSEVQDKHEDRPLEKRELLPKKNRDDSNNNSRSLRRSASAGVATTTTSSSIQSEKEGSHSRLLSRGGESSSFRGRTSSRREASTSFRKDTVSSSFRKEGVHSRRKSAKSFHDGDTSSVASESVRGSPCSIHYNQSPFSTKMNSQALNSSWISDTPSSPEGFYSSVPFHWEDAPGKAKTIAAAAEMALARKLSRDESLRMLNGASPRSSVDGASVQGERRTPSARRASSAAATASATAIPLPPSTREFSRELSQPQKKDPHTSQLLEDLKAAVVRKQADTLMARERTAVVEKEDDTKSVISDFGPAEEAHIDLVAPSAAKFLTQEDDMPVLTPIKTPASVPFKWEEAPGKPKGNVSPPPEPEPPQLSLPPRLLGGCRNLSKEAQAKILQTYSCNLSEMHWTASGNPTPLSRSRDHTPTRRERTPTRRDRTPSRRDLTPTRRDITPSRRDSTPTRSYFSNSRQIPKSGPISFPSVIPVIENGRDFHSGPLRPNSVGPNYLNAPPRSISQEFALPIVVPPRSSSQKEFHPPQENAVNVLTQEMSLSGPSSEDSGRRGHSSMKSSREGPLPARKETPADVMLESGVAESSTGRSSYGSKAGASTKAAAGPNADHCSPTSILCGPDLSIDTNRSNSNLSAFAESSHSQKQSVTTHTKSDSCSSEESFVDEIYDRQSWSGSISPVASPYRDLGPTDNPLESTQGNKALEDGVKALVKFCRKAKKWNKSRTPSRKNSQQEPDMWAPTLTTYFQKLELGGINKVGSQIYPEDKSLRSLYGPGGELSASRSPAKFIPRSGELGTPDRMALRRALGGQTPVANTSNCRSPSYRVLATDECFSIFSVQRVWNSTRARHIKWGKKMRRSSRIMASMCAALKRSLMLKCGRHNLPTLPSESKLLSREELELRGVDAVHALRANHQFHRPL
ncbi:hypothetical protein R1flu_026349 [Riccia fluitans]|uniref:Uncharacterized protein n=1 Tax=Riccia fluitans TaxID=41844 RepID=A0ABD1XFQ1_9MARC